MELRLLYGTATNVFVILFYLKREKLRIYGFH